MKSFSCFASFLQNPVFYCLFIFILCFALFSDDHLSCIFDRKPICPNNFLDFLLGRAAQIFAHTHKKNINSNTLSVYFLLWIKYDPFNTRRKISLLKTGRFWNSGEMNALFNTFERLNYCTDGHHLSSSRIIAEKFHAQFCRPKGILMHFMEPFNNMKSIILTYLPASKNNKGTNNYSQWCDPWRKDLSSRSTERWMRTRRWMRPKEPKPVRGPDTCTPAPPRMMVLRMKGELLSMACSLLSSKCVQIITSKPIAQSEPKQCHRRPLENSLLKLPPNINWKLKRHLRVQSTVPAAQPLCSPCPSKLITSCTSKISSVWMVPVADLVMRWACGMKCLHPVWRAALQETSSIKLFALHGDETRIENRPLCRQGLIYASLYKLEWKQPTEESKHWALSLRKLEFKLLMLILPSCFSNCPGEKDNNGTIFHVKCALWIAISWQKKKWEEKQVTHHVNLWWEWKLQEDVKVSTEYTEIKWNSQLCCWKMKWV